jgi:FKBP-type peptidyl-prolyl cis-trans isomerase FkpA
MSIIVLKSVKLPFLKYKRINLPFEIGMNRILLIWGLVFVCCVAACTKSSLYGPVQAKAQAKIDDSLLSRFIVANHLQGIAKHVQMNDTIGVYYIVLNPGSGQTLFTASTQITVGDTVKLIRNDLTEKIFYETNDFHPSYSIGGVIRAWQLGVPEILTGGTVRLLVPSRYAYGPYAQPQIGVDSLGKNGLPGSAVLDFYITLYNVTN